MIRVVHPGSRIRMLTFSHPGSRIRMLTFSHPGSRIQGSKRHPIPDPGSGSATLAQVRLNGKLIFRPVGAEGG